MRGRYAVSRDGGWTGGTGVPCAGGACAAAAASALRLCHAFANTAFFFCCVLRYSQCCLNRSLRVFHSSGVITSEGFTRFPPPNCMRGPPLRGQGRDGEGSVGGGITRGLLLGGANAGSGSGTHAGSGSTLSPNPSPASAVAQSSSDLCAASQRCLFLSCWMACFSAASISFGTMPTSSAASLTSWLTFAADACDSGGVSCAS